MKGIASATTGTVYGLYGTTTSSSGRGVFGEATATTGLNYGGRFESAGSTGRGIYGLATGTGATFGIYGVSQSPTGRGVRGSASSTTGINYGGYFDSASVAGYGVFATSDGIYGLYAETTATSGANYAVYGLSASTTGRGIYGQASSLTGNAYGVFGESQSTSGRAVVGLAKAATGTTYGGYFDSDSSAGYGVFANSAGTFGVYGQSTNVDGKGVFGTATGTGTTVGVRGEASSDNGTGVWGEGDLDEGTGVFGFGFDGVYGLGGDVGVRGYTTRSDGIGVKGETFAVGSIGVLGQESGSNPDYGVFAGGALGASGSKSFRIDHPQDPENKFLLHYSTESPFPQNFYSGNVVTDSKGKAWVDLPDYFHDINVNYKYQLTVVDNSESDRFVQVKVAREIANGRFMVMTSAPNVKVSWRVEADRNDIHMQVERPVDVKEKSGRARGKYQHPEHYDKPVSMGMFFSPKKAAFEAKLRKGK